GGLSGRSRPLPAIPPIAPRVQVTRTTRWPARTAFAIVPPVPIVSSSGWAWTVMRVWAMAESYRPTDRCACAQLLRLRRRRIGLRRARLARLEDDDRNRPP